MDMVESYACNREDQMATAINSTSKIGAAGRVIGETGTK
jgi:hypothetical protein